MRNRLKNKKFCLSANALLLSVASLFCACDGQVVCHAFRSLPLKGWQRNDTLVFETAVTDSLTYYRLSVEVRNRNGYPYRNLPLTVSCTAPDGQTLPTDSLQLSLANEDGTWRGKGWGGLYQTTFPAGSIRITQPGTYLFKIAYTLPDSLLTGINDVGIKLSK